MRRASSQSSVVAVLFITAGSVIAAQNCEIDPPSSLVLKFAPTSFKIAQPARATVISVASPAQGSVIVRRCETGRPVMITLTGDLRLKHEMRDAYLPFTLDWNQLAIPSPGPNGSAQLLIPGSLAPEALRHVPAGRYLGQFTVQISQ